MAEFPSQKLMHTRSCSATSTRGIYCFPCQDCQINLAVPLVLLVLQKHLELLAHWVGEAFDGNTLMGLYQTCSWVVMDWSAINSQINAFFFFSGSITIFCRIYPEPNILAIAPSLAQEQMALMGLP